MKSPAFGMTTPMRTLSPASLAHPVRGSSSAVARIRTSTRRIMEVSPSGDREGEAVEVLDEHLGAHPPAVDRCHHLAELVLGIAGEDESLTGPPRLGPPGAIPELGRDRLLPERQ